MTFEINILAILFVAELLLVLIGLSIFLSVRAVRRPSRKKGQSSAGVDKAAADQNSGHGVSTGWLEVQLEKIRESLYALIDEENLDKTKMHWKTVLELRYELLDSELKASKHSDDRSAWRSILDEAYSPLLLKGDDGNEQTDAPSSIAVEAVTRSEEEIARLRSIIDSQHGMVGTLKKELAELGEDSEQWKTVASRVDRVSHQGEELSRCANVLEFHNSRIIGKHDEEAEAEVTSQGQVEIAVGVDEQSASTPPVAIDDAEDLYGLKTLIGDQQATISKLRGMLDNLVPEAERGAELASMLDSIQRSNSELIGCVAILETENDRLAEQVEELRGQLAASTGEQKAEFEERQSA